jgi:hypothetical protein
MRNKYLRFFVYYILFFHLWIGILLIDYSINDLSLKKTIKNIFNNEEE